MKASPEYTHHTVYIVSGDTTYNVTPVLVSLERSDPDGQIAQRVNLQLMNVQVDGIWLSNLLNPRDRVYVYADDGSKNEEVFRGYLWKRNYQASISDRELSFTCYDNLIYFQESEDSLYFSSGKSTKDICAAICEKWGITLEYSYESITHEKLPLRGKLCDILTADILDSVRKKTKKKYVLLSNQDTTIIKTVGSNSTIYQFISGKNAVATASGWTMDGIITQVVIVGKADEDDREPIEATVSGKTSKYGTLQKILMLDENTTLEDAKLEAQNIIDENGVPKWKYEVSAADVPWIRKGDKVYVSAGDIYNRYLIVTAIDRTADKEENRMILTMEDMQQEG